MTVDGGFNFELTGFFDELDILFDNSFVELHASRIQGDWYSMSPNHQSINNSIHILLVEKRKIP